MDKSSSQRYLVEKHEPYGYSIIDTTGRDKPYTLDLTRDTASELAELDRRLMSDPTFGYDDYNLALVSGFNLVDGKYVHCHDPIYMSRTDLDRMEEHVRRTAQSWCDIWNLVESGYCGSCKRKFALDEKRYPATGWSSLYKVLCSYCAYSQDD